MSDSLADVMGRRVTRHFLLSFGTFALAVPLEIGLGFLVGALHLIPESGKAPVWVALLFVVPILLIPIVGFTSTFKNLRCPSCEKLVAFQVSANFSAFGGSASPNCRHCGAEIFGDRARRRNFLLVFVGVGVFIGLLVIIGAVSAHAHH